MASRWPKQPPGPEWLAPSTSHLHNPLAMHGMARAVGRIRQAQERSERIRIITDYDVDGTTSSLILQAVLRLAAPSATVDYHIPDRFTEGYGVSLQAVDLAAKAGVQLIVTADIGVRDHHAVARAKEHGIDVLICDHHLPAGASVPGHAIVLCPPQPDCTYPNPHLAACGVSLKLGQALLANHPRRDRVVDSLLKLAAIGTVADLVPLTTLENRAIVRLGLEQLNRGPHAPGLQALLRISGAEPGAIDERRLGFQVGPRINAAGRVADASLVVELLTARDPERAAHLANRLEQLNSERKAVQATLVKQALARVNGDADPFVLVAGPTSEGWHRGVVGIVAAKLKDALHRPVAVVSIQGDLAVGSIRSIPKVHAADALTAAADLLDKFGGHPGAAGFTVPTHQLDALHQRLCNYVTAHATPDDLVVHHTYDAVLDPSQVDRALYTAMRRLGPFGMGNPAPRFRLNQLNPSRIAVKASGRLLAFDIPGPQGPIEACWWGQATHAKALGQQPVDVLGRLTLHRWRATERLQLSVVDVRTTSPPG